MSIPAIPVNTLWYPDDGYQEIVQPKFLFTDYKERGLFPRGKVSSIVGPGGIGKSYLCLQLQYAIVTGTPFLEIYHPQHTRVEQKVFFLTGEDTQSDILVRSKRIVETLKLRNIPPRGRSVRAFDKDIFEFAVFKDFQYRGDVESSKTGELVKGLLTEECMETTHQFDALKSELIRKGPWAVVMIDPMITFAPSQTELDSSKARRFMQLVQSLTDLPGNPSVIITHHTAKGADGSNAEAARGSGVISTAVRFQVNLYHEKTKNDAPARLFFKVSKQNVTESPPRLELARVSTGVLIRSPEDYEPGDRVVCEDGVIMVEKGIEL